MPKKKQDTKQYKKLEIHNTENKNPKQENRHKSNIN